LNGPGAAKAGIVTTSLSVNYVGATALGQWLDVTPRIVKVGGSSGVVDALISADGVVVARADASFRVLR
jgi:acyl-coenzyme A thioesterase PaaI-like protein